MLLYLQNKMAWELDESVARGRPKMTRKDNVKREARKIGLREEEADTGTLSSPNKFVLEHFVGTLEKNDMDEWKQQPFARWKQCCLNYDDDEAML